jgi:hypothetical protein
MRHQWTRILGAGIALVLVASTAQAQPNAADITASATVLSPLTVVNQNDLDFGTVFPGVDASVAITDGTAGRWYITGADNAEVDLTFTLVANLTSGGNNLPIVFAAGDAGYNTTNLASAATTFDPNAGATTNLSNAATGELYVWIGGTVQPATGQPAGTYTETITLTVDYTGN